jgi:hypothetical protein
LRIRQQTPVAVEMADVPNRIAAARALNKAMPDDARKRVLAK